MNIIITGASGYIGKTLSHHLETGGHQVTPLSRQTASGSSIDYESQLPLYANGCDAVIHMAGIAHRSGVSSSDYEAVNVQLTKNLASLTSSLGIKRFLFFSTAKVHGEESSNPIHSGSPFDPQDEYSASKVRAEEFLATIQSQTQFTSLRPPVVYGSEPKANIATLSRRILKGQYIPVPRTPNVRSFVSLDNLCTAVDAILDTDHKDYRGYLVDDRRNRSTETFVSELAEQLNKTPKFIRLPNSGFSVVDRAASLVFKRRILLPLYANFDIQCDALERETRWQAT